MTRRQFFDLSRRLSLGSAAGLSLTTLAPLAHAVVDPATVLLIANTVAGVAGLFSSGSGIESLMHIQVEMLKQITAQLTVIQRGILEILNRLDDLERLIGRIPEQVVIRLYQEKMSGLLNGRYKDLMEEYEEEGYAGRANGSERENWLKRLESELLTPIRETRDVLMNNSESFALVPIICSASFVETHGMIFANYPKSQKLRVIRRYREWLTNISIGHGEKSLSGAIKLAEAAYVQSTAGKLTPETFTCYYSRNHMQGGPKSGSWDYLYGTVVSKPGISDHIATELDAAVHKMIMARELPAQDRPQSLTSRFEHAPQRFKKTRDEAWIVATPTCNDEITRRIALITRSSQELTQQGLQLVSLHALKHAATEGTAFLTKLSKGYESTK